MEDTSEFTPDGNAQFHRFIRDNAIREDLVGVVDVLRALRFIVVLSRRTLKSFGSILGEIRDHLTPPCLTESRAVDPGNIPRDQSTIDRDRVNTQDRFTDVCEASAPLMHFLTTAIGLS